MNKIYVVILSMDGEGFLEVAAAFESHKDASEACERLNARVEGQHLNYRVHGPITYL